MKILKILFALAGVVGLAVAGYYLFNAWVDIRSMMAIANANRSAEFVSPWQKVLTSTLLATAGALVLGLGIGLPMRTAGSVRKKALQDAADARELQIRDRAAARGDDREA
ncbi:hypothetical protein [Mariniluteicoccus endophyticus]